MTQKRILFVHKNFPAQFGTLGVWMARQGWDVTFATEREDVGKPSIRVVKFKPHREVTKGVHRYVAGLEASVITGQGFARTAVALRTKGYVPDIVVAHSGWGVGTFAKDVWPECKFVPYLEWFYASPSVDVTPHDKGPEDEIDHRAKTRVRNAPFWLDFSGADAALCPTKFQASQFPPMLREQLTVMHDGIDTDLHSPGPRNPELMAELGVPMDAEIMTWVTRGMEPARGFPEMMASLAVLQRKRPKLHTIIVGEDRVAYGAKGESWKARMLEAYDFDLSRIHFTGLVPRSRMVEIMRAGNLHLYLTAPFVLSWSLLDAMSCGCTLVASDVEPVREFLEDGVSGLLVNTYDHDGMVAAILRALDGGAEGFGARARQLIVDEFDAGRVIYPAKLAFFEGLLKA